MMEKKKKKKKILKKKMNNNEVIFRSLGTIQRSEDLESRNIEGYAIVFENYSKDLGGFTEIIHRSAITEEMLLNSDITMNVDHDDSRMLARYYKGEGTLELELREDGLFFRFQAPETALGDEVLYNVRHGNLFECSFKGIAPKSDITRYRTEDGYIQEINNITHLFDCAIVVRAAYGSTSVMSRDMESAQEQFEEIKREVDAAEAKKAREEIERAVEEANKKILDDLDTLKNDFLSEIK